MSHKIITIAQQKGGAGKTTVTAHLAVAFKNKGKNVAIIDIDPQGSLEQWYKVREATLGKDKTGIDFSSISGWRLHNEISRLKATTDLIIIDSPPHTQTETKTVIRAADIVIIPTQPSPTDFWATELTVNIVEKERIPYRILLNRVVKNSRLAMTITKKYNNLLDTKLGNRIAFADSMLDGLCASETSPSSQAAFEINILTNEIEDMLFPDQASNKNSDAKSKVAAK